MRERSRDAISRRAVGEFTRGRWSCVYVKKRVVSPTHKYPVVSTVPWPAVFCFPQQISISPGRFKKLRMAPRFSRHPIRPPRVWYLFTYRLITCLATLPVGYGMAQTTATLDMSLLISRNNRYGCLSTLVYVTWQVSDRSLYLHYAPTAESQQKPQRHEEKKIRVVS